MKGDPAVPFSMFRDGQFLHAALSLLPNICLSKEVEVGEGHGLWRAREADTLRWATLSRLRGSERYSFLRMRVAVMAQANPRNMGFGFCAADFGAGVWRIRGLEPDRIFSFFSPPIR